MWRLTSKSGGSSVEAYNLPPPPFGVHFREETEARLRRRLMWRLRWSSSSSSQAEVEVFSKKSSWKRRTPK